MRAVAPRAQIFLVSGNRTKQDTHFTRPPRTATDNLPLLSGRVLFFSGRPVRIRHRRLEPERIRPNRTQKSRHATVWFDQTVYTKLNGKRVLSALLVSQFSLYGGIATSSSCRPCRQHSAGIRVCLYHKVFISVVFPSNKNESPHTAIH